MQIGIFSCHQKEMEHKGGKGKSVMCVLYVLWLEKRHALRWSSVDQ